MSGTIKKIISYVVIIMSVVFLGYLSITSINSTVMVSEYDNVFFVRDNPIVHILIFALIVGVCVLIKKGTIHVPSLSLRAQKLFVVIVLAIYTIVLSLLCYKWRLLPTFDQEKVFNIAANVANYDFTAFLKGGYGEKWTNQWGYIMLLAFIYRIFGIRNMLAINVMNICCMTGTIYIIYLLSKKLFKGKNARVILLALCLFAPMWNYYSFVYGNIPAHFLCMLALYLLNEYLDKKKLWIGVLSGVVISIAVILKTTVMVFFIAMLVYLIMAIIGNKWSKKQLWHVLILAWLIVAFAGGGKITHAYMEHLTGMELGEGVPRMAHIAMGMHESGTKVAGWYDGYIDRVYEEGVYDYEMTENLALEDLRTSIRSFATNPVGAIGFFTRKINSCWIEPTYESIVIMLNRNVYAEDAACDVNILQMGRLGAVFKGYCNYIQSIIYLGALMYLLRLWRRRNGEELENNSHNLLFPAVHFIGMILFYILWEANSQYTFFPVLLIIPYAVMGIDYLSSDVVNAINGDSKVYGLQSVALIMMICVITVSRMIPEDNGAARMFYPAWNTDNYREYINELKQSPMKMSEWIDVDKTVYADTIDNNGRARFKAGRYLISSMVNGEPCLRESAFEAGKPVIAAIPVADNACGSGDNRIVLTSNENGYIFRFQSSQLVMDVSMASLEPGTIVQTWTPNGDSSQYFMFEEVSDGKYMIRYADNLALTLSQDGKVTVEEITGDDNQLWSVKKGV